MRFHPISVLGANGEIRSVRPGEPWPAPYRGSRYTMRRGGGLTYVGWERDPLSVRAEPYPRQLADTVRAVKGHNGSFRVTPHGAVITKVLRGGGTWWEPQYVGIYDEDLVFPGIDNAPATLTRGMYWTGLPFMHGEYWRVSPNSRLRNRLEWKSRGYVFSSTRGYPELFLACLDLRPGGGRIYITESGCVWMNVPDGDINPDHRTRLRRLQRSQLEDLKEARAYATLRLLRERIEATKGCRPLYVGRLAEFDHGEPPWTAFESSPPEDDGREA